MERLNNRSRLSPIQIFLKTALHFKFESALDEIAGINKVLGNYGTALGDVSQDAVVNYDSDVTTAQGIFKSLPAGQQPTQAQVAAVRRVLRRVLTVDAVGQPRPLLVCAVVGRVRAFPMGEDQVAADAVCRRGEGEWAPGQRRRLLRSDSG